MPAQDTDETYLPKEPLDLPRPREALPTELPKELPAPHPQSEQLTQDNGYRQVKTLLGWHAPGRPYKKRKREFYFNSLLIIIALEVIVFLFHDYTLMMVIIGIGFLSFALSTVPPHDFYYKVSSEGITVEDHFFLWQELYDFFFRRIADEDVLIVRTQGLYPGELVMTLGALHKEQVKQVLLPYLPYREYVKPTFMEQSGDWLSKTFPFERD